MNILNVISSLGLSLGGGNAERTFQLSRFLATQQNIECTVLTLKIDLDDSRISALRPSKVVLLTCLWRRYYLPFGGLLSIRKEVLKSDIIHLIGHWSILNLLVYLVARLVNKPYVVCPAGALPLFGRSSLKKRFYNFVFGRDIIKNANGWIAVTSDELSHFEEYGIPPSKVFIIPNGVNENDFLVADENQFRLRYKLTNTPFLLFMGRLNLIKGPDLLLQAFIRVQHLFPDYHLVFAGPDQGLLHILKNDARNAGVIERVHFLGHISNIEKTSAYRCARLLVVPSRHEAMSIVAIEAGICGTSILITDQCGFDEVKTIDPSWVVSASVSGLEEGITELLKDEKKLKNLSKSWYDLVKKNYSWNIIIKHYLNLYDKLCKENNST